MQRLGNLLRLRVVREQTHRTVAVGEEVNCVAPPHGIVVVRVLSRNFRHARVFQVGNPDGCGLTAAIALPCRLPLRMRHIGDMRAIRRECCFLTNGKGQLGWESALDGHRVELVLEVHEAVSKRRKENLFAVRRPAENVVLCGMISQPPGDAARGWNYVNVTIAIVLAGKRDERSIGGKCREVFDSDPRRKVPRFPAFAADDPEVVAVGENDLGFADRGEAQQERRVLGRRALRQQAWQ